MEGDAPHICSLVQRKQCHASFHSWVISAQSGPFLLEENVWVISLEGQEGSCEILYLGDSVSRNMTCYLFFIYHTVKKPSNRILPQFCLKRSKMPQKLTIKLIIIQVQMDWKEARPNYRALEVGFFVVVFFSFSLPWFFVVLVVRIALNRIWKTVVSGKES